MWRNNRSRGSLREECCISYEEAMGPLFLLSVSNALRSNCILSILMIWYHNCRERSWFLWRFGISRFSSVFLGLFLSCIITKFLWWLLLLDKQPRANSRQLIFYLQEDSSKSSSCFVQPKSSSCFVQPNDWRPQSLVLPLWCTQLSPSEMQSFCGVHLSPRIINLLDGINLYNPVSKDQGQISSLWKVVLSSYVYNIWILEKAQKPRIKG